jgi:protein-S-isoprenylcysteine O-methyltransferase Ste14
VASQEVHKVQERDKTTLRKRLASAFLDVAGWLIPLVASVPALHIWVGLMTLPLVTYLGIAFLSLFNPDIAFHGQSNPPPYFLVALDVLLLGGPYVPDKIISVLGVLIMVTSTLYLQINRGHGLVTAGPYRIVRNPQYVGAIVFMINLTSRCYRETLGDVGWLGSGGTLAVWLATLVAYILLALAEELHLATNYGEAYAAYRRRTPFLVPFVVTQRRWLEITLALVTPALLLWALVLVNKVWYP